MDHFDRQVRGVVLSEMFADAVFLSDQYDWNAVFGGSLNSALDFNQWRLIAAHRVDRDFDCGHEELFLSGLDDFPLLVIAAVWAGTMRHPQLMTIGAF